MDPYWEYSAPQYVDFENLESEDNADKFFDYDPHSGQPLDMDKEEAEFNKEATDMSQKVNEIQYIVVVVFLFIAIQEIPNLRLI